jgi:molecular chaperone DnaK (HSP70)
VAYTLGIDLGTTYTAAAVARDDRVEAFALATDGAVIPSVVVIREDGSVLTGEAAERRSIHEPTRTAREFKRRLGDPVPLVLGGTPYGPEAMLAYLLRDVVGAVRAGEGEAPGLIVLTHPANYGDYKTGLLAESVRLAGLDLDAVRFITEPEAAATSYASQARVEPGELVAVYDFGGGTFDAALVRKVDDGFELVGRPEGIERLGGIDFDQAVWVHVDRSLDGMIEQFDTDDPTVRAALARLRDDVRRAKEALSTDTDTTVAIALPGLSTEVRLTRNEFEAMIRPRIRETVEVLARVVASAGLEMSAVTRILLVGGSSRIPLVADVVREETGRPVVIDAHPKLSVATGAAIAFAGSDTTDPVVVVADDGGTSATRTGPGERSGRRRLVVASIAVVLGAGIGVAAYAAMRGNAHPSSGSTGTVSQRTSATSATSSTPPFTTSATEPATTSSPTSVQLTGSAPPELVHTFHQENWSLDESKDLTITSDGSYLFVDLIAGSRYVERGVVVADGNTIAFHANGPTDPVLGLDLGHPGSWTIADDDIGQPTLLLQIAGHRNYDGAGNTADLYYLS